MVREVREGEARIPAQGVETREEDWALAVGFEEREEGRRKGDEENEVSLSLARARSLSLSLFLCLSPSPSLPLSLEQKSEARGMAPRLSAMGRARMCSCRAGSSGRRLGLSGRVSLGFRFYGLGFSVRRGLGLSGRGSVGGRGHLFLRTHLNPKP